MTDLAVSARFLRAMQPIQYEKAEAEITVSGVASSPAQIGEFLDQAQRTVLAALGKSHEFRPAGLRPAAPTGEPDAPAPDVAKVSGRETAQVVEEATKPRRGRPPKAATVPTQTNLEDALAAAAGQPEPDAGKIAGADDASIKVDEKKDLPPVTDEELQTACANAAEKMGNAEAVKKLYRDNYRVAVVREIDPDMRRPFLKDLAALVAAKAAQ